MANKEYSKIHLMSPLTRMSLNHKARKEYRYQKRLSKGRGKHGRAIKKTAKLIAKERNVAAKRINSVIKTEGKYETKDGTTIIAPIRKVTYKQVMAEQAPKPNPPAIIKMNGPITLLFVATHNLRVTIANFVANLFTTKTKTNSKQHPRQHFTPQIPKAYSPPSQVTSTKDITLNAYNEVFQSTPTNVVDINKEFQKWLTKNKINDVPLPNIVFDFLKSATLNGYQTSEKSISDILTYAFENKCVYDSKTDTINMLFSTKQGIAAFAINNKGEISCPKTFTYNDKKYNNVITDKECKKIPQKVQLLSTGVKKSSSVTFRLINGQDLSKDNLQQVRNYLVQNKATELMPYVESAEKAFVSKNAIKLLNECVLKASYMNSLSEPKEVFDFGLIQPSLIMSKMANPAQFSNVFEFAQNQFIKGYSIKEAFAFSEMILMEQENAHNPDIRFLCLHSSEAQKEIISHIEKLETIGFSANEIINLVASYKDIASIEAIKINIALINQELLDKNKPIEQVIASPRLQDISIEKIAEQLSDEIKNNSPQFLQEQIRDNQAGSFLPIVLNCLSPTSFSQVVAKMDADTQKQLNEIVTYNIEDAVLNSSTPNFVTTVNDNVENMNVITTEDMDSR